VIEMMSAVDEREIRTSLRQVLSNFPDEYWMRHDLDHEFPWDFHQAMAEAGWLGMCIPEKYGGGGAGGQQAPSSFPARTVRPSARGRKACFAYLTKDGRPR
jgi:acyl-CoA dehydrogenase